MCRPHRCKSCTKPQLHNNDQLSVSDYAIRPNLNRSSQQPSRWLSALSQPQKICSSLGILIPFTFLSRIHICQLVEYSSLLQKPSIQRSRNVPVTKVQVSTTHIALPDLEPRSCAGDSALSALQLFGAAYLVKNPPQLDLVQVTYCDTQEIRWLKRRSRC